MVKEILIYIEGDTKQKGKSNAITLRQGFSSFFGKLSEELKIPIKPIMCGAREETIKIFLSQFPSDAKSAAFILVDADREITENETPKMFLQKLSTKFDFRKVNDEQCHLMVQLMESWFLADRGKLAEIYGREFNVKALPQNKEVEKIHKNDVLTGLENATRNCPKGKYGKGLHSGEILQKIDSSLVRSAAPHCEKLFAAIIEAAK